jgi:DNA replication protein DnaD
MVKTSKVQERMSKEVASMQKPVNLVNQQDVQQKNISVSNSGKNAIFPSKVNTNIDSMSMNTDLNETNVGIPYAQRMRNNNTDLNNNIDLKETDVGVPYAQRMRDSNNIDLNETNV